MRTILKRLRSRLVHSTGLHRKARFPLVAVGTCWLAGKHFYKNENLTARYGKSRPAMVRSILARAWGQREGLPGRNEQVYVSHPPHSFFRESYDDRWRNNLSGAFLLFLANVYKKIGLLDISEITYRLAFNTGRRPDLVAVGLGDLLLLEGSWTIEATAHAAAGEILDCELAPALQRCSRAWQMRPVKESIAEFQKALQSNPANKPAWWMLASALMKVRDWDESLNALQEYLKLAPAYYEQNIAMAVLEYGRDSEKGLKVLRKNFGRWLGWFHVSEVQVVDGASVKNRNCIPGKVILDAQVLQTAFHVLAKGEASLYRKDHQFQEVMAYNVSDAEVLPVYGMVVSKNKHMLKDTSHTFETHWHRYTPAIMSMKEDRALIAREMAATMDIDDAIFFGNNKNYYHYICEDIPRLLLLEEKLGTGNRPILVRHDLSAWQENLLVKLNFDSSRWRAVNFNMPLNFRHVTTVSLLSRDLVAHPAAIELVRRKLLGPKIGAESAPGKRFYLKRGTRRDRGTQFLNEDIIERRLQSAGFISVTPGSMSMDEQMTLFADAEIIAGAGGAALTNLVFAPPTCAALVFASSYDSGGTFSSLASAIGQDYYVCLGDGYAQPSPSWIHTSFDFAIDPKDLDQALKRIEARRLP